MQIYRADALHQEMTSVMLGIHALNKHTLYTDYDIAALVGVQKGNCVATCTKKYSASSVVGTIDCFKCRA